MTNAVSLAQQASTGVSQGFKNRIINGAMVIDQRNAGASFATNTGAERYTLDRWQAYYAAQNKYTVQQNAGSVTPPAGFRNYLGVTSSSAYTVGASEEFSINQYVEGFNWADLDWGSANAKTVTLSFWVRSSLTGTFGGAFRNYAGNRSYTYSYTISAANTWEYKTITIPGDTGGTWAGATNSGAVIIGLALGVGSSNSTAAGTWTAGNFQSVPGATSVVGTNGATFYITGVQLEVGSTATSFDYRPYGTELVLCQRYYEKSYNTDVALATSTSVGVVGATGVQGATTGSEISAAGFFRVTKRVTPTMSYFDTVGNSGKCTRVQQGVAITTNSSLADNSIGANQFSAFSANGATASSIIYHFTASAEL
jgi:hypothetical protein